MTALYTSTDAIASTRLPRGAVLLLSLIVPLVFLAVGIMTRNDWAETWDEQFDQDIGRFYVKDWPEKGVSGLEKRFIPLQRNYGPFFDIVIERCHLLLHDKLQIVKDRRVSYHLPVLAITVFGLWIVFWFGYRLFGLTAGLLASFGLAVMPQVIAHSQNNLKDTPLMVFFTAALFVFQEAVRRERLWLWALAGVLAGMTYGIKLHAVFLFLIVALWQLTEFRFERRRWTWLLIGFAVSLAAALATIPIVWPYYRHGYLGRMKETFATFANHEYNEYVFYLGQHVRAHEVPWHFPFVILGVNTPLVHLLFLAVALGILAYRLARLRPDRSPLVLLALWLFLPPVAHAVSGAIKLDGIRHYLLVLPAIALLSAFGLCRVGFWLSEKRGRGLARMYAAAVAFAFALVVAKDVAIHPYEGVFFNWLAGGIRGARDKFELDYWGNSLKPAAEWLNQNAAEGSRIWLPMPGQHFFHVERSRMHFVSGPNRRPNYKVNLLRGLLKTYDTEGDYLHPARKPVYAVTVDGADLLQIFEYEENRNLPDGTEIPPDSEELPQGLPGLSVQHFQDEDFRVPSGQPTVWQGLGFDCDHNEYVDKRVAVRASGVLAVHKTGLYTFEVFSDDEVVLYLRDVAVIINATETTTHRKVRLSRGSYRIRAEYRNDVGRACLRVAWSQTSDMLTPLAAPDVVR